MTKKHYQDKIHGLKSYTNTIQLAYADIKKECIERGLEIPKFSDIFEVKAKY